MFDYDYDRDDRDEAFWHACGYEPFWEESR